jgi:MinD superfamily P-loop ATPase
MTRVKELAVVSGKGGTGKTSLVACFAALAADDSVLVDCDVDAPDLHLILEPRIQRTVAFGGAYKAEIRRGACTNCGTCWSLCRFDAVRTGCGNAGEGMFCVDPAACEGCGVCVRMCPVQAIDFPEYTCGQWFVSETRFGTMVHARLKPGAENSGRLASVVRNEGRRIAPAGGSVIIDGPPGIGCPVIASITGASLVLAVTEPTPSGLHDLARVLTLVRHFGIPAAVCVNKWDLNRAMTEQIEQKAKDAGAAVAGRIRYDRVVTAAQVAGKAVVEFDGGAAAREIMSVWEILLRMMDHESVLRV